VKGVVGADAVEMAASPLTGSPDQVTATADSGIEAVIGRHGRASGVAATPGADALLLGFDQSASTPPPHP
jgi:hypothetical protein